MPAPSARPSICVAAQGRGSGAELSGPDLSDPDLSGQTLRDYQLLTGVSEREALERSAAPCFLWLAGGAALRPQTLEECVWGLQAADWVTWRDTGTAPPPSLRRCAGPLGVSRRVLEQPESRRSGRVRRLPWKCRAAEGARRPDFGPPSAPLPSPPAAAPLALRIKERLNKIAGKELFDLGAYLQSRPRAALIEGRLVEPLEYACPPKGRRKRLGVFTAAPNGGGKGGEKALREITALADRSRVEIVWAGPRRGAAEADWVYAAADLAPPRLTAKLLYSLALNWQFDALLLQGLPEAYALLPALKEKLPRLRTADVLRGGEDWDLFSASLDADGCLDRRAALSAEAKRRLWEMNVAEERIVLVSDEGRRALLEDLLEPG